jgi:hypothetical protein
MIEGNIEEKEGIRNEQERPGCFGDPQKVCPVDENGIMQPQTQCVGCGVLRSCLQKALRNRGILPPPLMESPVILKMTGFLKRWSDHKLNRKNPSQNN